MSLNSMHVRDDYRLSAQKAGASGFSSGKLSYRYNLPERGDELDSSSFSI